MIDIVVSCGDINGIGPEIVLKSIKHFEDRKDIRFIYFAPEAIFDVYPGYKKLKLIDELTNMAGDESVIIKTGKGEIELGNPTKISGEIAYQSLLSSIDYCKHHSTNSILVTSPLSKYALSLAGINMPGHTEILAESFNIKNYSMMFLSEEWKAALATIHIPIRAVSENISFEKLFDQLTLLIKSLSIDFGINHPEIALLGLNPHAGENGKIGNEEKMLEDVISKFENVNGPFVPDAFFARKKYKEVDLTLGMYHDQILIPFKLLNPNAGVNFTAGLPIVRTSPDHGTAFDIAGQNKADPQSFIHAINWGIKILNNRTVGNGK